MGKKWLPLESNPEVLNDFVNKLGYDTSKYAFCDVFGLDEVRQLVAMSSMNRTGVQPCLAMSTGTASNGTTACCGCAVLVSCDKGV